MTNTNLLEVKNLKKSYGKKLILKGIDINVNKAEIVGLLGPNGAGKTSIFYIISGAIHANKGEVLFNKKDISKLPMYKRSRLGIAYLAQEASIFRNLSVENNLMAILENIEPNKKVRISIRNEMIEKFRLNKVAKQLALTLSGGERRRLEIARCLITKPSLLMLDEPFSGVDPIAINEIKEIIINLQKEGLGILITDHNARETLKIVHHAYIVFNGKILANGTSEELIQNTKIQKIYIGENFSI